MARRTFMPKSTPVSLPISSSQTRAPTNIETHERELSPATPQLGRAGFMSSSTLASSTDHDSSQQNVSLRQKQRKIGRWLRFLLVASGVILSLSVGFLSWLYFCSRQDDRWRQLALGLWVTRSITLTGVGIRFAISTMATITTAIMAAIAVETYGVRLEDIAQASIARYTGSIVPMAFAGYAFQGLLRILIPLQLIVAIASQFSSTLLFIDIDNGVVQGFPTPSAVNYTFLETPTGSDLVRPGDDAGVPAHYRLNPSSFETFAEYAEPQNRISDPRIDDTGPIWRAFLPLASERDRTSVRRFEGAARLFDARVICVQPTITALNVTVTALELLNTEIVFDGLAETSIPIPNLLGPLDAGINVAFRCSVYGSSDGDRDIWQECYTVSVVPGDPSNMNAFGRFPSLNPVHYGGTIQDDSHFAFTQVGRTFILMNASSPEMGTYPNLETEGDSTFSALNITSSSSSGPWTDFVAVLDGGFREQRNFTTDEVITRFADLDIPLRATLCFDVTAPYAAPIRVFNLTATSSSKKNRTEPSFGWDLDKNQFVTFDSRRQLGATSEALDHEDRGVLSITAESMDDVLAEVKRHLTDGYEQTDTSQLIEKALRTGGVDGRNVYCKTDCGIPLIDEPDKSLAVHEASGFFTDLFQDTLDETGSPSLAIQAVRTTRARMEYYRWMSTYTASTDVMLTRLETALVPTGLIGYSIVIAMIALQVALLCVAGILFQKTRCSFLNNAWQVVAQISQSRETQDILSLATTRTEKAAFERAMPLGENYDEGKESQPRATKYAVKNGVFGPVDHIDGKDGGTRFRPSRGRMYMQVGGLEEV